MDDFEGRLLASRRHDTGISRPKATEPPAEGAWGRRGGSRARGRHGAIDVNSEHPQRFGNYRIVRELGSGGMAEVYLAVADGFAGFEREVCIKRIRPEYAFDEVFIRLLVEEAKLVSGLVHPNIVQVFDLGSEHGRHFIAMEYVDGYDLYSLLERASDRSVHFPIGAAAWIACEVARALAAAHAHADASGRPLGIVHRDVSPHNILIGRDGAVKLIDFGVAKAATRIQRTEAGVVKGKYNYLAPEQAAGQVVDARTDIFALGIVLFETLIGRPLYSATTVAQLLDQARRASVPSVRRLRRDVPASLEKVLARLTQKKPSQRYQRAGEAVEAFEAFLSSGAAGYAYGAADLIDFVDWLADGPTPMGANATTTVPSEERELEAAPTRVANQAEIEMRRAARAAGLEVRPVPIGLVHSTQSRKPAPSPRRGSRFALGLVLLVVIIASAIAAVHFAR